MAAEGNERYNEILRWALELDSATDIPHQQFDELSSLLTDPHRIYEFIAYLRNNINPGIDRDILALHRIFYKVVNPNFELFSTRTEYRDLRETGFTAPMQLQSDRISPASALDQMILGAEKKLLDLIASWGGPFRDLHVSGLLDVITTWLKGSPVLRHISIWNEDILEKYFTKCIITPLISYLQLCGAPVAKNVQAGMYDRRTHSDINISLCPGLFSEENGWDNRFEDLFGSSGVLGPCVLFLELKLANFLETLQHGNVIDFTTLAPPLGQCFTYVQDVKYRTSTFLLGNGDLQYLCVGKENQSAGSDLIDADMFVILKGRLVDNVLDSPKSYTFQQLIAALFLNHIFEEASIRSARLLKNRAWWLRETSLRHARWLNKLKYARWLDKNFKLELDLIGNVKYHNTRLKFPVVVSHELLEEAYPEIISCRSEKGKSRFYVLKVFSYLKDRDERYVEDQMVDDLDDVNDWTRSCFLTEVAANERIETLRSSSDLMSAITLSKVPKVQKRRNGNDEYSICDADIELQDCNESEIKKSLDLLNVPKFYKAADRVNIAIDDEIYWCSIMVSEYIEPVASYNYRMGIDVDTVFNSIRDSVDALYALGIVHDDIRLDNLRLTFSDREGKQDQKLYILDFDNSLVIESDTPEELILSTVAREQRFLQSTRDVLQHNASTLYLL